MKKSLMPLALVLSMALVATACGGGGEDGGEGGGSAQQGGVLREEITGLELTSTLDPTSEYLGTAWAYLQQMLIRGLVTYPFLGGSEGAVVVPDLATDTGTVSDDGLSWTFTLKDGVQWGPPLNRPITSTDVKFAFQRMNVPAISVGGYPSYYCGYIVGMDCDAESQDQDIPGIETPDDKTIIFRLTKPYGDLPYVLAQPAAYPIPPEVAGCFDEAKLYGRYLISSGPYMIQGADSLDATSCDTLQPIAGYDPEAHLYLVRNPSWDRATDEARLANMDGVAITVNTNTDDSFNKVLAGEIDVYHGTPPTAILQQYLTDPDLADNIHSESADRTWYITMNLLVPPFDDVNVRKAANLIVDKAAMLQAAGGSISGEIATSITPPEVMSTTAGYDPYATPEAAGDVDAAKAAMAASKYDSDGDGVCDADVCQDVLLINRDYEPWTKYTPILVENFAAIGIELVPSEIDYSQAYDVIGQAEKQIPIAVNAGWGKDYPSPSTFYGPLFASYGATCTGAYNYSYIGIDAARAEECGPKTLAAFNAVTENGSIPFPSVDDRLEVCLPLVGQEMIDCYTEIDRYLMEEVVPWVPYRWASAVVVTADTLGNYVFDQSSGLISYARISVSNGLTMEEVTGAA